MATFDVDVGGTTYEVDAPDERTAWRWANATHAKAPVAPATPPASRSDYLINSVKKGLGDLGGLADKVNFIPDLINQGAGALSLPKPFPSAQAGVDRTLSTNRTMEAPDTMTRYGGKALEMATAGGPFSGATIARSAHKLPSLMAEVSSAMGGGAGSELGGDVGQGLGSRGAGEVVGGLGGGVAGLVTPTALSKLYGLIAPRVSGSGRDQAVNQIAGRELGGALQANPNTTANLMESERVKQGLAEMGAGDFRPTIGQASGAEGVISTELGIARKSPEDLGRYATRASENQAVLDRLKEAAGPVASITRGADNIARATTKALDERLDLLNRQQEQLASIQFGGPPQQMVGERLQSLRDQAQATARQAKNARVQDLYGTADRLGVREDMSDIVGLVRKIGGADDSVFQTMPPVFGQVIREYGGKTENLTGRSIPPDLMNAAGITKQPVASFKELHSLFRETNSQYSAAQRAGDTTATYYLARLKEGLGEKLAKFEGQGFGELSNKFKDFNSWFASKYAPAFYEGVGGRMNAKGRYGEIVKPEDITSKFFTPSGIDDFNLIASNLPGAERTKAFNTLKDGVLGMFREKAVKDGVINQSAAKTFLRLNEETLNKVPDIKRALSDPVKYSEMLADRSARLSQAQKDFDKSLVAKIANGDAETVVQNALRSPKEMMSLIATAKTEANKRAVSRAIADGVTTAAEKAGVDPLTFVMQNERTLRQALSRLGPKHFDNIRLLASGQTILNRTSPPRTSEHHKMIGAIEDITGSTPRTILSQTGGVAANRQGPMYAISHLFSRFAIRMSEKQVANVLREVIYNPELAAGLIANANKPYSAGASNSLREHLANAGIRVGVTEQ